MSTTLLQMQIGNPTGNVGTSGTIRYYADKDFTALDGTKYKGGRVGSKDYFLSNTWSVSGGLLTVPTKTGFPTTTDASPNGAKITAAIYDSKGIHRGNLFENLRIPSGQPTPLSLLYLQTFNVAPQPVRSDETLTKTEFALMLDEAIGPADIAGVGVLGRIETATAPTDPLRPKAVETGDPRLGAINGIPVTGTPSLGQVPTATSPTAAVWQTPAGSGIQITDVTKAPYSADNTGATSPYVGIAAAIAAGAKRIYLPAGVYALAQADFTDHLTLFDLPDEVEFFGDGQGLTIITCPASLTLNASFNQNVLRSFSKNINVHDISWRGPTTVTGVHDLNAIAISSGSYRAHVHRNELYNWNANPSGGAGPIVTFQPYDQSEFTTTLGTSITAGEQTVTPASMNGLYVGRLISIGGTQEYVLITAATHTTFTAVFANNHSSADSVIVIDDGYQGAIIEENYIHDCFNASGMIINSTGNSVLNNKIVRVGQNVGIGTQHGLYVQAGGNLIKNNWLQGVGGYTIHEYFGGGQTKNFSGNIYDGNYFLDGVGSLMLISSFDTSDGTNPYLPAGTPMSRYTIIVNNVFRRAKDLDQTLGAEDISLQAPVIFDHNVLEDIQILTVGSPYSKIGTHNIINRIWQNTVTEILSPVGSGTAVSSVETAMSAMIGQSAYPRATTAGTRAGGNLELAGGTGSRLFTVNSNLAGAVTLTINLYGIQFFYRSGGNAASETVSAVSGVNFNLGSDDTAPQLAVTAVNIAAWINSNLSYGVSAKAVADVVYLTKGFGEVRLNISSNSSAITATNRPDGTVKVTGALATLPFTVPQITGDQDNYNPGSDSAIQRWSSDAARNVTGLAMPWVSGFGNSDRDGQIITIVNVGAQNIVLKHESASSSAANRFHNTTSADITLGADQQAQCWYDGTSLRWRCSKMN